MLACRNCRKLVTAEEGCAICLPLKAQLVTAEEDAEEFPTLSDVSYEAVAALQTVLRKYRKDLRTTEGEDWLKAEMGINRVGNTLAKALDAARKLQEDGIAAVKNMSFKERAALFAGWYQELAPGLRSKVRAGQDRFEEMVNRPLLHAGETAQEELR